MALLLTEQPELLRLEPLPHKTWTRAEIEVLQDTGMFDGLHYELIEGELIDKMGKMRRHVNGVLNSFKRLEGLFGEGFVNFEAPIDVAEADNPRNEPEPDVIVLRRPSGEFTSNPRAEDVLLVVEVSDSTLSQDRSTKARLYARAGIPEYWVLDLKDRRLLVFRNPNAGTYQVSLEIPETESVCPLERPSHPVTVSSLVP